MAVIGWASTNFNQMAKQTSVDWLIEQLKEYDFADIKDSENYIIKIPAWILTEKQEKAKEMEKEQIMEAHYAPKYGCFSEKYYDETFGDVV
jgi:hypothetical protein